MHIKTLILIGLLSTMTLSGCCSSPAVKQQTKGQIISKCLDDQSPNQCDKKYNP